ncbi:MAG: U32 family peptidase [Tenericutes bacterium]|nr:U32 family peptidase [Mycoplasmatota bacterium]
MNLVARLKTLEEFEKLNQLGVGVFCVDTVFAAKSLSIFSLAQLRELKNLTKINNKQMYVLINCMIHQDDLPSLTELLINLKEIEVDGIVISDLTVYVLAKDMGMDHLIIYQPGTMNTDSYSEEYFSKRKIKGLTISREITLDEIKLICRNKSGIEISLVIHGYLDMFYSKRKLLTNYLIHKEIEGKNLINNYNLRLNEEIRPNDFYPILEDKFGTHIFRSHKLLSIDEFSELKKIINTFFIERMFLPDKEYYDSIKLYSEKLAKEEFLNKYDSFDSGFYYKRTEKIKGELNES